MGLFQSELLLPSISFPVMMDYPSPCLSTDLHRAVSATGINNDHFIGNGDALEEFFNPVGLVFSYDGYTEDRLTGCMVRNVHVAG